MSAINIPTRFPRIYAIGDIHGRLDLLDKIIDAIHDDARNYAEGSLTITLGDYIDRGPDSRRVIDRLCTNPFPDRYHAIKGNHEDLLETFLKPQLNTSISEAIDIRQLLAKFEMTWHHAWGGRDVSGRFSR